MTDEQILAYVYAHTGSELDTGIVKPMVLAMADLAYEDLAKHLIDTKSEQAKKLSKTLSNQTWASSKFAAPTDMLFHKQDLTTRIDLGGTLAFQVADRDKLDMVATLSNHYYALEGKYFYIKHSSGTTGGSNLNITYYKIPLNSDIDSELRNTFLQFLIARLVPNGKSEQHSS